jgi:uncharacterized protein (TIGR00645 family)
MTTPRFKHAPERWLERGLFASRWLMAPFYVGLVGSLVALLVAFCQDFAHWVPKLLHSNQPDDAIVMALSLIDLSLAANLLLIVIFAGYENFVSKIDLAENVERPDWMGTLDFSGIKIKLITSIVTISAVALLRAFMALSEAGATPDILKLSWLVGLHVTFLLSGVALGFMDWLAQKAGH